MTITSIGASYIAESIWLLIIIVSCSALIITPNFLLLKFINKHKNYNKQEHRAVVFSWFLFIITFIAVSGITCYNGILFKKHHQESFSKIVNTTKNVSTTVPIAKENKVIKEHKKPVEKKEKQK
jgi:hypothetical protein